jgi:ribosomal protein S18 acetylase RimI-like enzyme
MTHRRTRVIALLSLLFAAVNSMTVTIRPATSKDLFSVRRVLFQEAMNPLSISERTLLVAAQSEEGDMVGFGQIRPLDSVYSELASLYVYPEHRNRGIGSALVEKLLERHDADPFHSKRVCLLTLKPTMKFYEKHGFVEHMSIDDLPSALQFEFRAGSLVSSMLGNDICCMVRDAKE